MSSPPSSRPSRPAGVPESGNAKYAIVAILLLLGAGGLFLWRNHASQDQPAPVPPVAAQPPATASTNAKLDDIPLPPPPEEKPEAGPAPKVVYAQASGGGCEAKCVGTAPPELEQALQVRGSQARRCYNQALAQDSSLKGHVTIAVKVGSSGNLCAANVVANDMGSASVAACAANIFRANSGYPAPHGGCVEANIPLSFVPQGQ
jgi:hypothetical protein